jgi:hypothetical protein
MSKKKRKLTDWYPIDEKRYQWDKDIKLTAISGTPLKLIAQYINRYYGLSFSPGRIASRLYVMGVYVSEEKQRLEKIRAATTFQRICEHRPKTFSGFRDPKQLKQQIAEVGRKQFMKVK